MVGGEPPYRHRRSLGSMYSLTVRRYNRMV
jgi:hypothetical protein